MDDHSQILIDAKIYQAKQLIYKKKATLGDLERAKQILVDCKNMGAMEDYHLENELGKIDLLEAKLLLASSPSSDISLYLQRAKTHFYSSLTIQPGSTMAHFGLMKVAILEDDYEEAFEQLKKYDQDERYNFELMYQLLGKLTKGTYVGSARSGEYIQCCKVSYPPLLHNYQLAEMAFEEGNFQKVLKHLEICNTLAMKKNIHIDFSYMILLADMIFKKYREDYKKQLKLSFMQENHIGDRMVIAQKLVNLDQQDAESYFLFMDTYLDLKVTSPLEEICRTVRNIPLTAWQEKTLESYEKLVKEKKIESEFMELLDELCAYGRQLEAEGKIEEAIAHYDAGYQKLDYPYFQVKKAQVCYRNQNYSECLKYAEQYMQEGAFYYVQASTLAYKVYRRQNDIVSAIQEAIKCYHQTRMKERGYSLHDWLDQLKLQYEHETSVDPMGTSPKTMVYQKKHECVKISV